MARRHGLAVDVSGFEDWPDRGRRFDLIVSGQAWHWVEPRAGLRRAHDVLDADGRICLCWNYDTPPADLRDRLDAVYAPYRDRLDPEEVTGVESRIGRYRDQLVASELFSDVTTCEFPWRRPMTADEYADMISTYSDHAALPEPDRTALLDGIRAVVAGAGGVEIGYVAYAVCAGPVPVAG